LINIVESKYDKRDWKTTAGDAEPKLSSVVQVSDKERGNADERY